MSEKVDSGLEVVAWLLEGGRFYRHSAMTTEAEADRRIAERKDDTVKSALVRQSDADRALQQQHEAHRKTWRQLEQVTEVLELARSHIVEVCTAMNVPLPASTIRRIDVVLSQQAELSVAFVSLTDSPIDPNCRVVESPALYAQRLGRCKRSVEPAPAQGEREILTEGELEASGLGYPLPKAVACALWYEGFRSEPISVLEAWEAIGHDIGCNPSKQELLDSLRNMAAICEVHGNDMPRPAQTEQQPVQAVHIGWDYLDDGTKVATFFVRCAGNKPPKLYAAPIAQTEQQPEQSDIDPLLNAGAALSNIAFNLAQRPGVTLDQHVCDLLSSSRKHWDEARAALSATPSPTENGHD